MKRLEIAVRILPGLMLRHQEPGYTDSGAISEALALADKMIAFTESTTHNKEG